jgi:hypothetical protein
MNKLQKTNAILLSALLVVYSAVSYSSEYEFGYSNPVPMGGSSWGMSDSLFPVPSMEGVDINGVFYRYTAVKDRPDDFTVSIQNEAAIGGGYIFRETDDWSGRSGGTIQKFVPVPYSPVGDWGDGSIEQVGVGSVEDPLVLYSYRFDPDRVQQQAQEAYDFSQVSTYDALNDRNVLAALAPTDPKLYESDEDEKEGDDTSEEESRLETALAASENALTIGSQMTQAAMVKAMNIATNMNTYYASNIPGGVYKETTELVDSNIPDNKRGLFAVMGPQQKLHKELVDSQY